jgi:hypothetical protein
MPLKSFVKQVLPPFFFKIIKTFKYPKIRYDSYKSAMQACPESAYEGDELVKVVVEKNLIYRNKLNNETTFDLATLRILIAFAGMSNPKDSISVIDFGGGGGYHYSIAEKFSIKK